MDIPPSIPVNVILSSDVVIYPLNSIPFLVRFIVVPKNVIDNYGVHGV